MNYLSVHDVIYIHDLLIQKYGGSFGLRSFSMLESAVLRPQNSYYTDIVQESAALFESLLINHPFIDGNKRVAFAACDLFLKMNSYKIEASPQELYLLIIKWIEQKDKRFEQIEQDLRSIIKQQ